MLAIYKKELKTLFHNITGWLFLGITLALFGLYFYVYNLLYGYPYVSYSLSAISFIFMITVPILTMRVFAEEKHNKTDQLLLTYPVSLWKIILGKFFATVSVFTLCILVICVAPIVLGIYGEVAWLETYVAILGFWLFGTCAIAIGLMVSAMTENQVIAAILTFVLLFLGYMMSSFLGVGNSSQGLLKKILGCYDLYTPLESFMNGTLPLQYVFYYISIIFLSLFVVYEIMQKRRWSISKRTVSLSVFSITTVAVVIAGVVLGNYGVGKIPKKYTEFDVTSKKIYSITEETKEYLKKLKQDITIYVYVDKKEKDENVDKTLSQYESASKYIHVKYINPGSNPKFAEKYKEDGLNKNSVVVVCGDKYKVIDYGSEENSYADSQIFEYTMDSQTYSYVVSGYDLEGQVTSAISYVQSDVSTKVYVLTGHEEIALPAACQDVFDKKAIEVESLQLLQTDEVPEDCAALFIQGPQLDFSKDDVEKIQKYIQNGGAVFLSLDYKAYENATNMKQLLQEFSIVTQEGIVGETNSSYYYQNPYFLLPVVEDTWLSQQVAGTGAVFAPYSIGMEYVGEEEVISFLTSSEDSFSKSYTNLSREREEEAQDSLFQKEVGDTTGPFSLGLMVTNENGGRFTVLGSSYLLTDNANDIVSGRNAKLFQGIVDGMIEEKENQGTVVIPVKDFSVTSITVSQKMAWIYGVLWGIGMPLLAIVFGVIVWLKRRKK